MTFSSYVGVLVAAIASFAFGAAWYTALGRQWMTARGGTPMSVRSGLVSGFFLWLGFVITTMAVNHAFQGERRMLTVIDGGHWLGVLLIQSAILGWWLAT
jgi:hypothetical protein